MTSSKFLRPLLVLLTTPVLLPAQCELQWQPSSGYPGADAPVRASTCWDPDGSGPIAEVAVVAGDFTVCGDAIANGIVMQSPSGDGWLPLGGGIVGSVRAVLPLPGGELIAAGTFAQAGGVAVANVARWSGGQWSALGTGIGGTVNALARLPNGDLVAGGEFTTAGGAAANYLARWDGGAWHAFGAGTDAAVAAMAVGLDGTLYVGGPFWSVDGVPAAHIASWRNGVWTEPGGGVPAYGVFAMCILPNGDLVIGYHNLVARWNGLFWSDLQVPMGNSVRVLRPGSAGEIWCGTSSSLAQLLRWQAGTWTACVRVLLPMGNAAVHTVLPLPSGEVLVGGTFTARAPYGPQPPFGTPPRIGALQHLLRWDGQQAHALGGGFDASVWGLAHGLADDILACGQFEAVGSDERRGLARWSGGAWLGAGAAPINPSFPVALPWEGPAAIGALANGDLAVAGCFTEALPSGSYVNYQAAVVSLSSATRLLPRSAPTLVPVAGGNAVVRRDDGHLLIGSTQGVHLMSPAGALLGRIAYMGCNDLCVTADGDILLALQDATVAVGNGTTWTTLGGSFSVVGWPSNSSPHCVRSTRHGPVVGGSFEFAGSTPANRIARWDGVAWQPLGSGLNGLVEAILELPDGDLLVGGSFTTAGGVAAAHLARWNGSTWSAIAGGGTNGPVHALLLAGDGTVWVGGDFTVAGGAGCGHIAKLATPCAATAVSFGSGCVGSGGMNTLLATSQPWLGSTFRSRADGLPSPGLAVVVNGLSTWTIPLSLLLPFGSSGCDLRVTPDVLDLALPTAGSAALQLSLPPSTVWTGQQLFQQVVPLELDAGGNLIAATATNALLLTVGDM